MQKDLNEQTSENETENMFGVVVNKRKDIEEQVKNDEVVRRFESTTALCYIQYKAILDLIASELVAYVFPPVS